MRGERRAQAIMEFMDVSQRLRTIENDTLSLRFIEIHERRLFFFARVGT